MQKREKIERQNKGWSRGRFSRHLIRHKPCAQVRTTSKNQKAATKPVPPIMSPIKKDEFE